MKNPSLVSHISPPDMFGKPQESKLKFCGFFSITAIWFSPVSKWKMLYLTLQLFSLSLCLLSVVPRGWTVWSDTEWLRVEGAGVLSSYLLPGKTADSSGGWWCRHIPNLPQHAHTWIYHNISTHTHTHLFKYTHAFQLFFKNLSEVIPDSSDGSVQPVQHSCLRRAESWLKFRHFWDTELIVLKKNPSYLGAVLKKNRGPTPGRVDGQRDLRGVISSNRAFTKHCAHVSAYFILQQLNYLGLIAYVGLLEARLHMFSVWMFSLLEHSIIHCNSYWWQHPPSIAFCHWWPVWHSPLYLSQRSVYGRLLLTDRCAILTAEVLSKSNSRIIYDYIIYKVLQEIWLTREP